MVELIVRHFLLCLGLWCLNFSRRFFIGVDLAGPREDVLDDGQYAHYEVTPSNIIEGMLNLLIRMKSFGSELDHPERADKERNVE